MASLSEASDLNSSPSTPLSSLSRAAPTFIPSFQSQQQPNQPRTRQDLPLDVGNEDTTSTSCTNPSAASIAESLNSTNGGTNDGTPLTPEDISEAMSTFSRQGINVGLSTMNDINLTQHSTRYTVCPRVELVVRDFRKEYGEMKGVMGWKALREKIQGFNRIPDHDEASHSHGHACMTSRVHLIITDPSVTKLTQLSFCTNLHKITVPHVKKVDHQTFYYCKNLIAAHLPSALTIGMRVFYQCTSLKEVEIPKVVKMSQRAFSTCYALRHVVVSKDARMKTDDVFKDCLMLELLATSTGFLSHPVGSSTSVCDSILEYLKWRTEMDVLKDGYKSTMRMLRLCDDEMKGKDYEGTGKMRATPVDRGSKFMVENQDVGRFICSFLQGVKRGMGDLREEGRTALIEIAKELNVLDRGISNSQARRERKDRAMMYWS